MQRPLSFAVAALCGAALALPASAQPPEASAPAAPLAPIDAFMKQDTNGDGKIGQDEAKAPQVARFKAMDANADGSVTTDEARANIEAQISPEMLKQMKERGMPDMGEMFVKRLDTNSDGKVDESELEQPVIQAFKKVDTDGDGFVSKDEAAAFLSQLEQRMREQAERMRQQPPAPAPAQ